MAAVEEKVVAAEETAAEKATATEHETNASKYIGAAAGNTQWDDGTGSDADQDVQGEANNKCSWSDGKKSVSTYVEFDDLNDVADIASSCTTQMSRVGGPSDDAEPKKKRPSIEEGDQVAERRRQPRTVQGSVAWPILKSAADKT